MSVSGLPDYPVAELGPEGFFGPDSLAWQVFTAPATALMIAQITNLLEVPHIDFQSVLVDHDPLFPTNRKRQRGLGSARKDGYFHDRLRRTLSVPLPILFADKQSAVACADRLMHYHRPMTGQPTEDAPAYSATSPETMLFGAVTISHAALTAYERFAFRQGRLPRRLSVADRDRYFAEMSTLAIMMGVPAADVPMTATQVDAYYRSIAAKFKLRRGFRSAQFKAAAALVVPRGWRDVPKTAGDIGLMASAAVACAALPRPSRRLNGLPAVADPMLYALYAASLPLFALLSLPGIRSLVLRWYLGAADTATLTAARRTLSPPSKPRSVPGICMTDPSPLPAGTGPIAMTEAEALALFDSLASCPVATLRGRWAGREVLTGGPLDGALANVSWYGKQFDGIHAVHPLMVRDRAGHPFALKPSAVPMRLISHPIPAPRWIPRLAPRLVTALKPILRARTYGADLTTTTFRGVTTAAMAYRDKPVVDVFRLVDENTVLGLMDYPGMSKPCFFVLHRDPQTS